MSKLKGNGFSAKGFLAETAGMDLEARGLAITLICHRMANGTLPRCKRSLARLSGAFPDEIDRHWDDIEPLVFPGAAPGTIARVTPEAAEAVDVEAIRSRDGDQLNPAELFVVVQEVMAAYVDHHPRSKPGPADEQRIRRRLREGFSMDDLLLAIEGCHRSPHHCGDNERNRKYQNFELIMRDGNKVNQFIELAHDRTGKGSTKERATASAAQTLLNMEFPDDPR